MIDKESISFRVFLHELLDKFEQSWPVYDIVTDGKPIALIPANTEKTEVIEKNDTGIATRQSSEKINGNIIDKHVGNNVSNGEQVALIQVDKEKPEVTEKSDTEGYVCFTNRESSEQKCVKINGHTDNHVGENGRTITIEADEEKLSSTAEPEKDQTLSVDISEGIPIDFIIDVKDWFR